jgi:hypothetical protein
MWFLKCISYFKKLKYEYSGKHMDLKRQSTYKSENISLRDLNRSPPVVKGRQGVHKQYFLRTKHVTFKNLVRKHHGSKRKRKDNIKRKCVVLLICGPTFPEV